MGLVLGAVTESENHQSCEMEGTAFFEVPYFSTDLLGIQSLMRVLRIKAVPNVISLELKGI